MQFRMVCLSLAVGIIVLPSGAHAQRESYYPRYDDARIAERQVRAEERASRIAERSAERAADRSLDRESSRAAERNAQRSADRIANRVGDRVANPAWDADRFDRELTRQDREARMRNRLELRRPFGPRYRDPQ